MIDTDERVDLSDLALLDDGLTHRCCEVCYLPPWRALETYIADCGKRVVARREGAGPDVVPNPCPDCAACMGCPRCGAW